jgi:hypothetical protein
METHACIAYTVIACPITALESVYNTRAPALDSARHAHRSYSGANFLAAAALLLESCGAVPRTRMEQYLGALASSNPHYQQAAGQPLLLAMVEDGLFHLRPFSAMAQDIPLEKYDDDDKMLVTATCPSDLYWMAQHKVELKELQEQGDEVSAAHTAVHRLWVSTWCRRRAQA